MAPFIKLFWGFLFLFDFNIGSFDILPDVVGYLFFYLGLSELSINSRYFETARWLSVPLIFIGVIDLFPVNSIIINIVTFILSLLLIYNITRGVGEMAKNVGNFLFEEKARKRWVIYLYTNVVSFLLIMLGFLVPVLLVIAVIPLVIAMLVIYIMLMLLMKEANEVL